MRAEFGQKDGNAQAERNGDQHGYERGNKRSINRSERAQNGHRLKLWRPTAGDKKFEAKGFHGWPSTSNQRKDNACEKEQNSIGCRARRE